MTMQETALNPSVVEAMAIAMLPEVEWQQGDDLCDCTFQRIGWWTNPYLAETLEVRMCCIWKELYKQFPDFVRTIPAFYDYNRNQWVTQPAEWDGELDMPRDMFYRQKARQEGVSLPEARERYAETPAPRGWRGPIVYLQNGSEWLPVALRLG